MNKSFMSFDFFEFFPFISYKHKFYCSNLDSCYLSLVMMENVPEVQEVTASQVALSNAPTESIKQPTTPIAAVSSTLTAPTSESIVAPISIFARATAQAPTYVIPAELRLINWDDAMVQVGDDEDFLAEVLADLEQESVEAQDDIAAALSTKDFDKLMKAAHRIKGSTSYLCCEIMNHCALKMEVLASSQCPDSKAPMTCTPEAASVQIEELLTLFNNALVELKAAIKNRFGQEA